MANEHGDPSRMAHLAQAPTFKFKAPEKEMYMWASWNQSGYISVEVVFGERKAVRINVYIHWIRNKPHNRSTQIGCTNHLIDNFARKVLKK